MSPHDVHDPSERSADDARRRALGSIEYLNQQVEAIRERLDRPDEERQVRLSSIDMTFGDWFKLFFRMLPALLLAELILGLVLVLIIALAIMLFPGLRG